MTERINRLEKRKAVVLKMRSNFKWNADKEDVAFERKLTKYDEILHQITTALKIEWAKSYK